MALFGLFKSKEEKSIDELMKSTLSTLFPMGDEDIRRDCDRVGEIINWKLQGDDLKGFVIGCKTMVAISDTLDDDGFVQSNLRRSNNRITTEQARDVYIYLAGESMMRANFAGRMKAIGESIPSELEQELSRLRRIWSSGTTTDSIPGGYGDYGLVATNPIPTVCIRGSERYLAKLRFAGAPVKHSRAGSVGSEVTGGSIDVYKLSQHGRDVGTIYICPYHRRDSKKAPKGFSLS